MYSERQLIAKLSRRFGAPSAICGIGDDTAILELPPGHSALFCSDLLVENVHFRTDTHPPDSIGYRAVAVNVSDVGAMGGIPRYCVLSLAVPAETTREWADRFFDGVTRACDHFGAELVGGDTSASEQIFVDVAMLGHVESGQAVKRDGARPGDGVYVTGSLGGSARGLELLGTAGSDDPFVRQHLYPTPRHEIGRALRSQATSMIDISDGLSRDLTHVLEASGVSARIDSRLIPRTGGISLELSLHGGEDYELIVTGQDLPANISGTPLTRIGEIVASGPKHENRIIGDSGEQRLEVGGWQHFG